MRRWIAIATLVAMLFAGVANAREHRSSSARRHFEEETGYRHGRHGYIIDHIEPLACGGRDDPSNMQWQTRDDAKAKDRWERRGCR